MAISTIRVESNDEEKDRYDGKETNRINRILLMPMQRELFKKLMRQEQKQPEKLRNSKGGKDLVIAVVRHLRSMLLGYCMTYAQIMCFIWPAWFS